MSVLSDLERELGLSDSDLSLFKESELNAYDGVDYSTPSASSLERITEETESIIEARKFERDKQWTTDSEFDGKETAISLGVPTINVINLYQHVLDVYKGTGRNDVRTLCYKILVGLYFNNLNRNDCNDLINELNRMMR